MVNPQRDRNIVVPTVCEISNENISQTIHQHFGHVYTARLKLTERKGLIEGLPENFPDLEEP